MGFHAFTSAVLLAQGRFAQFLQSTPRDRDVILRELFGIASLDDARTAALAARDAAAREAACSNASARSCRCNAAAARTAQARLTRSAAARVAGIGTLRRWSTRRCWSGRAHARPQRVRTRITAALAELPTPEQRRALVELHSAPRLKCTRRKAISDEAHESMADAADARDRLRERHGGTAAELAALRGLAERATIAREAIPREEATARDQEGELARQRELGWTDYRPRSPPRATTAKHSPPWPTR